MYKSSNRYRLDCKGFFLHWDSIHNFNAGKKDCNEKIPASHHRFWVDPLHRIWIQTTYSQDQQCLQGICYHVKGKRSY